MSVLNSGRPSYKARAQLHGLMNHGSTCYLNSVLQVLFMTRDFRDAVHRDGRHTDRADPQLKALFDDLKRGAAKTSKIQHKLGIHGVHGQRDAAECFEQILNLTSPEASQIFHGELTHETECSACLKKTNASGHFWHLPLKLVDSPGEHFIVVDGIKEYFQTSHFSGENQLYCERCDSKCDATIKCQIKHHPEVLTLLLKRFDFDPRYMSYVKNNCAVYVPFTLQIPQNQKYELYAVVEHFGDLQGGHYMASIKSQDDESWYKFNDANVTLLDYQPFQIDDTEKYHNAYLLFYRKKTKDMQDTSNMLNNKGIPSAAGGYDKTKLTYQEKRKEEKTPWFPEETRKDAQHERYASIDKKSTTEGNEESGRKRKSSINYFERDAKHSKHQGLDNIRYVDRDQAAGIRQGYDFDEDKRRGGIRDGEEVKAKYDNYYESQGGERSGHRPQNMSTSGSWGQRRGSKGLNKNTEHQREERREGKEETEHKRRDDETAQSRRTAHRYGHSGVDVEDRNAGRSGEERQSRPEHRTVVSAGRGLSQGQAGKNQGVQRGQRSSDRQEKAEKPGERRESFKIKSDPQANDEDSLTKPFHGLNLNETQLQEENEAGVVLYSRGAYAMKKKGKKMKRWTLCFPVLRRKRKNKVQIPKSDKDM